MHGLVCHSSIELRPFQTLRFPQLFFLFFLLFFSSSALVLCITRRSVLVLFSMFRGRIFDVSPFCDGSECSIVRIKSPSPLQLISISAFFPCVSVQTRSRHFPWEGVDRIHVDLVNFYDFFRLRLSDQVKVYGIQVYFVIFYYFFC